MTWAGKRKLIIALVIGLLLAVSAGVIAYFTLYEAPSCIDGKQNQKEEGIDCGGTCTYLCSVSQAAPSVRFVRAVSPIPGRTDVIAYVDNPNSKAAAYHAPYSIELYNNENVLVAKTQGVADLPALGTAPLFVSSLFSGSQIVSHAFLTFSTEGTKWVRASPLPKSFEAQNVLYTQGENPRVTADIHNFTVERKTGLYFIATLFGTDGKALAASATLIDILPPQGNASVVFTWPQPIEGDVARVDIIPVLSLPSP